MQIKSVDNLLQAITEKLYITKTNKYKNALPELEETYNTIIIMLIENLDYQEVDEKNLFSNLKKIKITSTNQNIEEYQKKIIHKLNKEEEIKAYSFLPTGLGHYENIDELMNQLIRQSTLEEKKYIYVNINIDDKSTLENPLKNLIKENQPKMGVPLFMMVITGTEIAYKTENNILVVPIGCLKN